MGSTEHKTNLGAILNISLKLLLITYAIYKFQFAIKWKGIQLLQYEEANYFSPDDHFSHNEGLMFTAQMIDLSAKGLQIPPEVGKLRI